MVVTSFTGVGAVNGAKPASAAISSVWKEDGYHAYLYYQTKTWDYRDPLKTGKEYSYVQAGGQDVTEKAEITDVLLKKVTESTLLRFQVLTLQVQMHLT